MNTDKLKLFTSEEELRRYLRVNGMDIGAIEKTVAEWSNLDKSSDSSSTEKVAMLDLSNIETKEV
jgi:hypothetical protein